ncbi:dihydropteroate synthase [Fulvivirgaceae bacterium PWU20]|uniref:dihydropteroate synthase n=2 Tax=Chryseosolibacter indicus TaxID=2782351 RepID=A0ABS5VSF1_9BACT|nr:dihydropteroate synthase [Chryseosolibacter indicus]MBT1704342.1 dihydropteroate synthase [Chryseosolibacter indicus]
MGILNVTPDSFFDGGKYLSERQILSQVEEIESQGATFIDIGGYSSRPGAADVSETEEISRVLPAIKLINKNFPSLIISVDTFRSKVAEVAVKEGASIINDISGGTLDTKMFEIVAAFNVPYILMHMKGTPQTMLREAKYENLLKEIIDYFHAKVHQLHSLGVKDIILDPGFGFAKTREHNFKLLNDLNLLYILGKPILVGLSRKSMVWKTLDIEPKDALNGTTSLNTIALINGASILRVHDVKEAAQAVKLVKALKDNL